MTVFPAGIAEVRELLTVAETDGRGLFVLAEPLRLGLWSFDTATDRAYARTGLVYLATRLPNTEETIAAVFACQPELRTAWLRVIAARLRELGKRRDSAELCQAIDPLGEASLRIRNELPHSNLQSTGHGTLETALFAAPAEQAVVWPKLLRMIGATAELIEGECGQAVTALPTVEPLDPKRTWCNGRLLQLPVVRETALQDLKFVLSGDFGPLSDTEQGGGDMKSQALMRWVLFRPWVTLLAQIAFVQEAWDAEQISGRLTLEVADDQLANPYEPSRVDVVVTTADGEEILCGTLADLVLRVLGRLGVTLLARPEEVAQLDLRLGPVVHRLLEQKVWRFEPRGSGGRRPGFVIDDDFSTSCYRAFGSKYFYRGGSVLTAAIRLTCEQWAREKLSESGASHSRDWPAAIEERVAV
jgi:hypothetical protein